MTNDPIVDPKVGDGISRTFKTKAGVGCVIREVTRAHGGFVFFNHDNGATVRRRIVSIGQWRKWAQTAEILGNNADNPGGGFHD